MRFPGRAPPIPSPGYVDHPQASLGSHCRPGTAPGPAGDCPSPSRPCRRSITQVKVRTRAKSRVSIETRELRLSFGNAISRELTSLIRRGFSVLLCSFLGERYPKIYFALYSMLQFYGFSVCCCLHQVAKMALLCNVLLFLRLFFFGIMILLT